MAGYEECGMQYCRARNFEGASFRGMAREPSEEIFRGCNINAKKPHPPKALHVKYRCVGVSPSFNFRVDRSALEKSKQFAAIYTVHHMCVCCTGITYCRCVVFEAQCMETCAYIHVHAVLYA